MVNYLITIVLFIAANHRLVPPLFSWSLFVGLRCARLGPFGRRFGGASRRAFRRGRGGAADGALRRREARHPRGRLRREVGAKARAFGVRRRQRSATFLFFCSSGVRRGGSVGWLRVIWSGPSGIIFLEPKLSKTGFVPTLLSPTLEGQP